MAFFLALMMAIFTGLSVHGVDMKQNAAVTTQVQSLEQAVDGNDLHLDGMVVRNLNDEKIH